MELSGPPPHFASHFGAAASLYLFLAPSGQPALLMTTGHFRVPFPRGAKLRPPSFEGIPQNEGTALLHPKKLGCKIAAVFVFGPQNYGRPFIRLIWIVNIGEAYAKWPLTCGFECVGSLVNFLLTVGASRICGVGPSPSCPWGI